MVRWFGIKDLNNNNVVSDIENLYNISTNNSFKEFIRLYNAGNVSPHPYIYDANLSKGIILCKVLSFNKDDDDNVYDVIDTILKSGVSIKYLPFAKCIDSYLCINNTNLSLWDTTLKSFCDVFVPINTIIRTITN